jgi:Kef-type K+ transport system membrane component KefB
VAGAIGLPLATLTVYLLQFWPWPRGNSFPAELGPYLLSLLTGLPFVWRLTRRSGRIAMVLAFLGGGFILLWLYALAVLCGVRGVCL